MAIDHMTPLDREIAQTSARLEALRADLRNTPYVFRASQAFLDKAAEKQKLLARLEALRRLAAL